MVDEFDDILSDREEINGQSVMEREMPNFWSCTYIITSGSAKSPTAMTAILAGWYQRW